MKWDDVWPEEKPQMPDECSEGHSFPLFELEQCDHDRDEWICQSCVLESKLNAN